MAEDRSIWRRGYDAVRDATWGRKTATDRGNERSEKEFAEVSAALLKNPSANWSTERTGELKLSGTDQDQALNQTHRERQQQQSDYWRSRHLDHPTTSRLEYQTAILKSGEVEPHVVREAQGVTYRSPLNLNAPEHRAAQPNLSPIASHKQTQSLR